MNKKRTIAITLLSIIITAAALLTVLVMLVFDRAPLPPLPPVTVQENIDTAKLSGRLMTQISQAFGKQQEQLTLTLSKDELDLLLKHAARYHELNKKADDPSFLASSSANGITFQLSQPVAWGYCRFQICAEPEIADNKFTVRVKSCSLGSIALPARKVENAIAEKIAEKQSDPRFQLMLNAVESLTMQQDGSIKAVINCQAAAMAAGALL